MIMKTAFVIKLEHIPVFRSHNGMEEILVPSIMERSEIPFNP